MQFNTLEYFLFFPLVFLLYYALPAKKRWLLLLAASYFFYMCWNVKYIFLLLYSTIVDYCCAIQIESSKEKSLKKRWMFISILSNLGMLFFFKYFNFFGESTENILGWFNIKTAFPDFDILLPVGISFYTFQSLSYTLDVYRGDTKAERHFGYFSLFISFFPQLVAGPIERANHLLPHLKETQHFNYSKAVSGDKLIDFGLFKKAVIADRLAPYVATVYNNPNHLEGFPVIIATVFFAIQIYCDFSGYSDMAIGSARILGFNLMKNFNLPYLSKSIASFWRRWHISLNTWFADYVFTPMATNKRDWGKSAVVFAAVVTFSVSGLWHGAKWTFVIWGLLHGIAISYDLLSKKWRKSISKKTPIFLYNTFSWLLTFSFVCFTYIFFRANSVSDAFQIIEKSLHISKVQIGFYMFQDTTLRNEELLISVSMILLLFAFETIQFKYNDLASRFTKAPLALRWIIYIIVVLAIVYLGVFERDQFIYFQF